MSDEREVPDLVAQMAAFYRDRNGLSADAPLNVIDRDHPYPGVPYDEDEWRPSA